MRQVTWKESRMVPVWGSTVQWRFQPLGSEVDGPLGAPLVPVVMVVVLWAGWLVGMMEVGRSAAGVPLAAGGVAAGGVTAGGVPLGGVTPGNVTATGVTAGLGLATAVGLGLPTVTSGLSGYSGFSGFSGEDVVSADDAVPMECSL